MSHARPRTLARTLASALLALAALGGAGCKHRRHHHPDAEVVGYPGQVPGMQGYPQMQGQMPGMQQGQIPGMPGYPGMQQGQMPGQMPGQVPGMPAYPQMPNAMAGAGLMVPPPVATQPDNPAMPVPPPGVMRVIPNSQ
jgi:hypothetical protein